MPRDRGHAWELFPDTAKASMEIQAKPLADQITDLILKRETNKCALLDKEAQRLTNKERFLRHGEHTSVTERVSLDAEIAHLAADRQRSKVELLKLKQLARETRGATLVDLLVKALQAHGLDDEIEKARVQANDTLRHAGLFDAYAVSL